MFLMKALANAPLVLLAPIGYMKLIFTAIFAYFLFNEVITLNTIAGGALIIMGTFLLMYQPRREKVLS